MADYVPTEEEREHILLLERFGDHLKQWRSARSTEERAKARSTINRLVDRVQEIVNLAGCRQTMTIAPPPAVGGLVMQNVDPFNYMFENVYGRDLNGHVYDMLDQTMGVIESGKFQQRRSALSKRVGPMGPISGKRAFVVHGHDHGVKEEVARFLARLGLEPVVLHEQASAGKTVIEKVEHFSEVAVAVVLLTPDDVGGKRGDEPKPRARQNVILELGYFLGKLGRSRVVAMVAGDLERPSDYDGVVYVDLDPKGGWKLGRARELKAAGLDVDLNDAA